jgi:hypothetical protein
MTFTGAHCMRDDPQLLSKRLAEFVRQLPAKDLSERVGCDLRTAENMRRGHWPIARHWLGLLAAFGEDLTEAVFHPERAEARLAREVAELEEQIRRKRAALEDAERHAARLAALRAPSKDRPAAGLTDPPNRSR